MAEIEVVDMSMFLMSMGQPAHPPLFGVKLDGTVVASFEDIPSLNISGQGMAKEFAKTLTRLGGIMTGFKVGQKVKHIHEPEMYGEGYVVAIGSMGDHRDILWMGVPGNPESVARQVLTVHVGNMLEVEG